MRTQDFLKLTLLAFVLFGITAIITLSLRPQPDANSTVPTLMVLPSEEPHTEVPAQVVLAPTDIPPTATDTATTIPTAEPTATEITPEIILSTATPLVLEMVTSAPTEPVIVLPTMTSAPVQMVIAPIEPVQNQVVITFSDDSTEAERNAYIESIGGEITQSITDLNTVIVQVDDAQEDAPSSALVVETEPDYYVSAAQDSFSDPYFGDQWGLVAMQVPQALRAYPNPAQTIIVAVIDSGICADHEDLSNRILQGWDYVENDAQPDDLYGHGCSVAGVIAANTNNGIGISGIAPNAQILPMRVLDQRGLGTHSSVARAIVDAANQGADLINLSLGGAVSSTVLENAVQYAISRGLIVVAAAGNTQGGDVFYPAAYPDVIAVGSVNQALEHSPFNAVGPIDVYAPGENIVALKLDNQYGGVSGTSFAAPQVAGIIALELGRGIPLVSFQGQVITAYVGTIPESTLDVTVEPTLIVSQPTQEITPITSLPEAIQRPTVPNLSSALSELVQALEANDLSSYVEEVSDLSLRGNQVQVTFMMLSEDAANTARPLILALGGEITGQYSAFIDAWMPISQLEPAAQIPGISLLERVWRVFPAQHLEEPEPPEPVLNAQAGSHTTQGVTLSNANNWHTAGYTGTGVHIGIIDTGFLYYTNAQSTGNLPASLNFYPNLASLAMNSAHGTAVAEIIHDMAPSAQLTLATPETVVDMANYIRALADMDVDIISSSMLFLPYYASNTNQNPAPTDGTGPIAEAINYAYAQGTLYVQAAGNYGDSHWRGTFTDGFNDRWHDFQPDQINNPGSPDDNEVLCLNGPTCAPYTYNNDRIQVSLRWNDYPLSCQDYDLYLVRFTGTVWQSVAGGLNDQISSCSNGAGTIPPVEIFSYSVPNGSAIYGIAIQQYSATANHSLDIMVYTGDYMEHVVPGYSLGDPAAPLSSFAVAAVNANAPYNREYYSSVGPAYGTNNNWSVPGNSQPRISGYAVVSTYVWPNFNGTSAATPHVAGAAALVMQMYPDYTPAQVRSFLESRAIDINTAGYDYLTGAGRLMLGAQLPSNINLLMNGDFSSGLSPWGAWGGSYTITGGILDISRNAGTANGGTAQNTSHVLPPNSPVEMTFQIGNSSGVSRTAQIYVNSSGWVQSQVCAFTIPPNTPLRAYTMRFRTNVTWTGVAVNVLLQNADGQYGLRFDNFNLQYKPALSVTSLECVEPPIPAETNLLTNGDFSSGLSPWSIWGGSYNITGGVLGISRNAGTANGGFVQNTNNNIPTNAPLEMTFQIGNSSGVARSALVYVNSLGWSQSQMCSITIPANTALQTYTMRFHTNVAWTGVAVNVLLQNADGVQGLRFDNFNLQYKPALSVTSLECVEPTIPAETNLLTNGDFTSGLSPWGAWGGSYTITGGVLNISRNAGTTNGGFAQNTNNNIPTNAPLEMTFQIGNSSGVTRSALVYVNSLGWSQSQMCSITIPANTALQTYTMRFRTNVAWTGVAVNVLLQNADGVQGLRFDNFNLQYKPAMSVTSLECLGGMTGLSIELTPTSTITITPTTEPTVTLTSSVEMTETVEPTLEPSATATLTFEPSATLTETVIPTLVMPTETPIPTLAPSTETPVPTLVIPTETPVPTSVPPTETPVPTIVIPTEAPILPTIAPPEETQAA